MRKYHLSALNLFWGLSPLSSLCTGSLCDNTNAETQTGNNSSPNGGPSDLGFASLTHTRAEGEPGAHTTSPSLFLCLQIGKNERECQKDKHSTSLSLTHTHACARADTLSLSHTCTHPSERSTSDERSGLPLSRLFTDGRPEEIQPRGVPSKVSTHQPQQKQQRQTEKVFTEPPSLPLSCLDGYFYFQGFFGGGFQKLCRKGLLIKLKKTPIKQWKYLPLDFFLGFLFFSFF